MPKAFVARDRFAKKAKEKGFLARSAFKLGELNQKFRLLKPGDKILDLGAAPGSWLQVASKAVEPGGRALGIDIQPVNWSAPNVTTLQQDIFDRNLLELLKAGGQFDVILSDLAPRTSGNKNRDQALSLALAERALQIADVVLRPGGSLVVKIFQSPETRGFAARLKKSFAAVRIHKPKASRERSFEIYIIGLGKID